jgi:predicted Zn-dependent peptidase
LNWLLVSLLLYPSGMPIQYREHVLPSGLRVVGEIDPEAASAAAGFFVRSGARDEPDELMGISHFLEHMVFKGTDTRGGEEIDEAFDGLGVHHNAYTSHETTAFHVHGLPEVLHPALTILADIMRPALRADDLSDEAEVVVEEIAMYEDQPFWQLWEKVAETYYGSHPMGHRVLGTAETVRAVTPERMRSWHADRYGADNIVLAVSGKVEFDETCELAASLCDGWPRTGAERAAHEMTHSEQGFTTQNDRISAAYVLGIAPAPAFQDDRRYAAGILSWILGRGEGSRLHWALVDPGHAEEAYSEYEGNDRCGRYVTWAVCEPERVESVGATMRTVHDELVDSITEDDLVVARAMVRTAVTVASELPAGRMQRLGRMISTTGVYIPLEDELSRINAITIDELREVAIAWPLQPLVTGRMVGPPSQ